MPDIQLSTGITLHYLDLNSAGKPTILLLHGLGATCESWELQFPALVQMGCRVIAPDARGFGKSIYPGGSNSIELMAADIAALLDSVAPYPVVVAGISMGGTIALQMACDYAQFVDRLVLINTFARLRPAKITGWFYYLVRFLLIHTLGLPTQARAVSWRIFPGTDQEIFRQALFEQVIQANPVGYRSVMRSLARFNLRPRLREIKIPTLVVTAANDTTVHPANQIELLQEIPGAIQVIIQDAGHAVTIDQPEIFNRIFHDFIFKKDSF